MKKSDLNTNSDSSGQYLANDFVASFIVGLVL